MSGWDGDDGYASAECKPIPAEKTLRDEFATAALAGMLAAGSIAAVPDLAQDAYIFADAMMEARKQ